MTKRRERLLMIALVIIATLVIALCIIYLQGAFGERRGNVFTVTNFDSKTTAMLANYLRISPANEIQFKDANMVGGKDWTLYVCFETSQQGWEQILQLVSFKTRKGREEDVPLEMGALPWWKINRDKIDAILCAEEGYTAIVAMEIESGVRRVFVYTDGGPAGFPKSAWNIFKEKGSKHKKGS